MRNFSALLAGLSALVLVACDHSPPAVAAAPGALPAPPVPAPASALALPSPPAPPPAAPPPAPTEPPPLEATEPFLDLPVEGHAAAVVSLPLGARGKRPVVIAAHGNFNRPEWQCDVWRGIVGDRAFVLCPRGFTRPDSPSRDDVRFSYETNQSLEREVRDALAALQARFPEHADVDQPLYTGFSLGAIMGVSIAVRAPAQVPRLVLIEGGHDKWTPASAAAFAAGGGKRVLFVCSQASCELDAKRARRSLDAAGVAARVVRGRDVGHRYDGPTADETKRALSWVLEGDARFGDAP